MPKFGKSKEALLHCADWLIENDRIQGTMDPNIFNVTTPGIAMPVCCRLFWNGKFHICSCGSQSRPCAHLVACLYKTKSVKTMEDVLKIPKKGFNPQ